jgi:RHS repeat-associated protein
MIPVLRAGLCMAAAVVAFALPRAAAAQCIVIPPNQQTQPCTDTAAPTLSISPSSSTTTQTPVSVTVQWSDRSDGTVVSKIRWNGADVRSSFTVTRSIDSVIVIDEGRVGVEKGTATGSVPLVTGQANRLEVEICDRHGNCVQGTRRYGPISTGVRVTAEGGPLFVPGGTEAVARFRVSNTWTVDNSVTFTALCQTNFSSCTPSTTVLTLAPSDSAWVEVAFTPPGSGAGSVQLTAASEGGGSHAGAVSVTGLTPAQAGYVGDAPSLERIERSACVTIGLGGGVANECGDLRVVHPLPAVRVLNRLRAPTLVYNHNHAGPYIIVAAHVTPHPGVRPDTVRAYLTVGGVAATRRWPGWPSDTAKRVGVGVEAHTMATGVYDYRLDVVAEWNGSPARDTLRSQSGKLAHVNRNGSTFGAGWWLAGVERLHLQPGDSLVLWVGGDGSARIYRGAAGGTQWVAAGYSSPDTLRKVGAEYFRTLPGGVKVWFDAAGFHRRTVNHLGLQTEFRWETSGSSTRLASIVLPTPAGQSDTLRYLFEYGGTVAGCTTTTAGLTRVGAPAPGGGYRYTSICADGSRQVTRITDPDGTSVGFTYGSTYMMSSRTDRRGGVALFEYSGRQFNSHRRVIALADTATTGFNQGARLGVTTATPVADVYLQLIGPRPGVSDNAYFWLGPWGAPTRIRDAAGLVTTIERADPRWPAAVTRVVAPGGFASTATYDARGRVSTTTAWNPYGDGRNATTSYEWDPVWDAVTRVVAPEGELTQMRYDSVGRREWEQSGTDASRRVNYAYYPKSHASAPGLVQSVTLPGGAAEQYEYDSRGNLSATQSPLGLRTVFRSDRVGRVVRSWVPATPEGGQAGTRTDTTSYDAADRVVRVHTTGPVAGVAFPPRLLVMSTYDAEGNLTSVSRSSNPDPAAIGTVTTRWRYDLAGRQTVEIAPDATADTLDNPRDSTVYDRAGNPVAVYSRNYADSLGSPSRQAGPVTMVYDAANRLTKRRLPSVSYAVRDQGISLRGFIEAHEGLGTNVAYPWYSNQSGGGLLIEADSALFAYDGEGRLVRADNGAAQVRRSYYPNGALRGDTLRIRTMIPLAQGGSFTAHSYGLEMGYDRNGRRMALKHPQQLAPRSASGAVLDLSTWTYDRQTGGLSGITDPLGNAISFQHGDRGELQAITRPGGVVQRYRYDDDGRLLADSVTGTFPGLPAVLRAETYEYDESGKLVWARNKTAPFDTMYAEYSGMGHLVDGFSRSHGSNRLGHGAAYGSYSHMILDALGNRVASQDSTTFVTAGFEEQHYSFGEFNYQIGTGRLLYGGNVMQGDTFHYDASGNEIFTTQPRPDALQRQPLRDRASFYAADGTLRAAELRVIDNPDAGAQAFYSRAFEEYRYDALGRRVWVRAQQRCKQGSDVYHSCVLGRVRRTVWDGDRELYEIQMPGTDTQYLENDTAAVHQSTIHSGSVPVDPDPYYGRVAYTYGGGVDKPLSIVRMGYVDQRDSIGFLLSPWTPAAFAIFPVWNERGQPIFGVHQNGDTRYCVGNRCARIGWPQSWFAYERPEFQYTGWQGTLLEDKQDATGTHYRRNRYYDPTSGRFTQEDPIGLAGGLNVYGFAAGDPVTYSDPYGLKVCANARHLRRAVERATNSTIEWDASNCVSSMDEVTFHGSAAWSQIRDQFTTFVNSGAIYHVNRGVPGRENPLGCNPGCSWYDYDTLTAWIFDEDFDRIHEGTFYKGLAYRTCGFSLGRPRYTAASLVLHELFGHGQFSTWVLGTHSNPRLFSYENAYDRIRDRPERCY